MTVKAHNQLQFQYPYHKCNDEISDMNTTQRELHAQFDCISVRHHLKHGMHMTLDEKNHHPASDIKWLQALHHLHLL